MYIHLSSRPKPPLVVEGWLYILATIKVLRRAMLAIRNELLRDFRDPIRDLPRRSSHCQGIQLEVLSLARGARCIKEFLTLVDIPARRPAKRLTRINRREAAHP